MILFISLYLFILIYSYKILINYEKLRISICGAAYTASLYGCMHGMYLNSALSLTELSGKAKKETLTFLQNPCNYALRQTGL